MDRRTFMAGSATATAGALAVFGGATPGSAEETGGAGGTGSGGDHVRSITAVTQVFGDGQKLVAVAVEYDSDIDGSTLSTFTVTDRTVIKVYANRTADLAQRSRDGRYVIVELSPDDTAAALWVTRQGSGTPSDGGSDGAGSGGDSGSGDDGGGPGAGGPKVGDTNVATEGPLVQGLGAACWASPEDQARHESFVLAPEYGSVVIDDNYEPSTLFEATANLVRSVTQEYGIDPDRLYTTGQSMGAMMSLGLNIRYPDLFAAAFVVAGQWPESQAAPLAQKKLWILVSADDTKAYPGEQAITEVIRDQGAQVSTALWDGRSTAAEFAADVRSMKAQRTPVNFAAFEAGTVVPALVRRGGGASATVTE
ncbi:alpha/beta hydrolase-fold protein [Streptomyces sp. NPDC058694]|uniref:alpha/beta hydrolase-fold protein n=1 Tax=Streptomyces sp. NPDC058694 TaxID=3346603 RepID=UPI0036493009